MSRDDLRLVWADEFDGPDGAPPDPASWRFELGGGGWGNDELQRYTDHPDNAMLDGQGNLVLRARRDGEGFTSARLITKGLREFTYGVFEMRMRVPVGAGLWSAGWMLGGDIDAAGWPGCGEIDIMEHLGADPARVLGTLHCPGHSGAGGVSGALVSPRWLGEAFHDYAVDWRADEIVWSLDGQPYHRVARDALGAAWVFDHPFYLLLNLAVGGTLGGAVAPDTLFPAELTVAHVRVYAHG